MVAQSHGTATPQLSLPGMVVAERQPVALHCGSVTPGQQVQYVGRVSGGPRFLSRGVVKQALQRKAIVDLGHGGTWHIPYYFLEMPEAA